MEWGCKRSQTSIEPIKADLKAAPEWLLKVISCNCKSTSRKQYMTKACSCQQKGLQCVAAWGDCHGEGCGNSELPQSVTDDENEQSSMVVDQDERNLSDILESFI